MDWLWDLTGRSLLIVIGLSALWAATAGFAIASYGSFPRWIGIVVGGLFNLPALAVLLGVAGARRARARRALGAPSPRAVEGDTGGGRSLWGDDTGSSSGSLWGDRAGSSESSGWSGGSLWGDDAAGDPWASADSSLGSADMAVANGDPAAPAERRRRFWVTAPVGWIVTALILIGAGLLLLSLTADWVSFDTGLTSTFWFRAAGTALDIAVLVSAAVAFAVAALAVWRPLRAAMVVLSWVANAWLGFALLVLSAHYSITYWLLQIGDFSVEIGEVLGGLGIADGLQLGEISMDSLPEFTSQIGPGIPLLLIFGVLGNLAAIVALVSADRAQRSAAPERGFGGLA